MPDNYFDSFIQSASETTQESYKLFLSNQKSFDAVELSQKANRLADSAPSADRTTVRLTILASLVGQALADLTAPGTGRANAPLSRA